MRITIATCWSELNAWQKKQIAYALLTFSSEDEKELQSFYTTLLKILVMQKNSLRGKIRWFRVLQQVPLSALLPYVEHFLSQKDLLDFPDISRELIIPGSRMNNCTIKQFSVCDAVFYKYKTCKHPNDKDLYARQLVASLYVLKSKKESKFDTLDLPKVADITDKIDPKLRYQIVFTFLCVREYITNRYKKIFPKSNLEDEQIKPDFRNRSYVPFSKVIHSMAMDERQPLGNLHECNKTLVYDFLDILQESIIRHEK